ncbi:MAG: DNA polymerase III subunit beta [Alphaproteobacteria bacterium]|nr:DNA polymerase III subunit beta [Alphaproteobacteria bacterium]
MKITLERSALLKSLNHVQSVVERRNTIPILSNVLLDATKGSLSLTATDLDIEIVESLAADVARPGATTASAHMLYDIVRKLPDGAQVQIELMGESGRITLSAGRSRFQLGALPREDFPAMTAGSLPHAFAVPASDLKRLIDKTRFAISNEETRYYLNGIYLHAAKGKDAVTLRAVATDGHRLARFDLPAPAGSEAMPGVIVPRKTVAEVRKLIDDADGEVEIAVSDTKIRFAFGDAVVTSKLIDGTFPDYQRVIPTGNDKPLFVDRAAFQEAVDRVSTVASDRTRAVKMTIEDGKVTLNVVNPEQGSASEELVADFSGDGFDIGFNARYLMDITAALNGDQAQFLFADAGSPTIVRDAGEKADPATLYVIMPMRV